MYKEIYVLECWKNHSGQDGLSTTSCEINQTECQRQIVSLSFSVIQYENFAPS